MEGLGLEGEEGQERGKELFEIGLADVAVRVDLVAIGTSMRNVSIVLAEPPWFVLLQERHKYLLKALDIRR